MIKLKNNVFDVMTKEEIYDLITMDVETFLLEHSLYSKQEITDTKEFIRLLLK